MGESVVLEMHTHNLQIEFAGAEAMHLLVYMAC